MSRPKALFLLNLTCRCSAFYYYSKQPVPLEGAFWGDLDIILKKKERNYWGEYILLKHFPQWWGAGRWCHVCAHIQREEPWSVFFLNFLFCIGVKATHSSILAWRIPWTIQSMVLERVRHDWVIAYSERCRICYRQGFNFGTRDQAWSLKSFCGAEFYYKKEQGKLLTWPLDSVSKGVKCLLIGYYSKSKECLKVVKILLDPLP